MRNPEACLSLPPAALQLSPSFGLDTEWEILAGTWPLRPGCPPGAHSLRAHHAAALSSHSACSAVSFPVPPVVPAQMPPPQASPPGALCVKYRLSIALHVLSYFYSNKFQLKQE